MIRTLHNIALAIGKNFLIVLNIIMNDLN